METDFTPLFSSDLARDVRAEMVECFNSGGSISSATAHALSHFRDVLADPNDGPVVILAVAAFQLDHAQLQPLIRDAAVDLIDSGEAESAWKAPDAEARQQRRQLLQQLLASLKQAVVVVET